MKVVLKNVRLRFHDLWEAKSVMGSAPKYGATFIIEPGSQNHKDLEQTIKECAALQWKTKASEVLESIRPNSNKFPLREGKEKPNVSGYENMFFIGAKNADRVRILDSDKTELTQEDGRIYPGCYVHASIDVYATAKYGNQIAARLDGLMFVRDGDHFTAGVTFNPNDFDDLSEGGLLEEFA